MTRDELLDVFKRSGALLEGHFRLTSGLHSSGYLQCALVLQHPQHAEALGRALGERTRGLRPTLVLSPALGGIVIGQALRSFESLRIAPSTVEGRPAQGGRPATSVCRTFRSSTSICQRMSPTSVRFARRDCR